MIVNNGTSRVIPSPNSQSQRLLIALVLVLIIGYLLQLSTPFRVNTDSIRLHYMAIGIQEGIGPYGFGEKQFPPLFPLMLSVIEVCGFASSFTFVLINLLSLAIGLYFTLLIMRLANDTSASMRTLIVVLTLSSWIIVKHITIALTDIPYFATSSAALYFMEKARVPSQGNSIFLFILSAILIAISIGIRTIGIALIPAMAFSLLSFFQARKNIFIYISSILLALICFISYILYTSNYVHSFIEHISNGVGMIRVIENVFWMRFRDVGEFILNIPSAKFPVRFEMIFVAIGGVTVLVILSLLFRCIHRWTCPEIYCLFILGILGIWPFSDSRFLIPVIPLIWWFVIRSAPCNYPVFNKVCLCLLCVYIFLGVAAITFSARLSFSGSKFPDLYSKDLQNSYRVAYGLPAIQSSKPAEQATVRLIKRYQFRELF